MNILKKIYIVSTLFFINFWTFKEALAQAVVGGDAGGGAGDTILENPLSAGSFAEFIESILSIVVQVGLPLIVVFMMYVGFLFIKAQGNEQELTKAKTAFVYAVMGAALILGAWVISVGIKNTIEGLS